VADEDSLSREEAIEIDLRTTRDSTGRVLLPDLEVLDDILKLNEEYKKVGSMKLVQDLRNLKPRKFDLEKSYHYRILDEVILESLEFFLGDDGEPLEFTSEDEATQFMEGNSLTLADFEIFPVEGYSIRKYPTFSAEEQSESALGQSIRTLRRHYGEEREYYVSRYARNAADMVDSAQAAQVRWLSRWQNNRQQRARWRSAELAKGDEPKKMKWPVGDHIGVQVRASKDYELIQNMFGIELDYPSVALVKAEVVIRRGKGDREPSLIHKKNKADEPLETMRPSSILRDVVDRMQELSWRVDVIFAEDSNEPYALLSQNVLATELLTKPEILDLPLSDLRHVFSTSPPRLDMHDSIDVAASLIAHHHEAVLFRWDAAEYRPLAEDSLHIADVLDDGWHIVTQFDIVYYLTHLR